MRLAAQAKMGYYPVSSATIAFVCKGIKIKDPAKVRILDPCCGRGGALRDLGQNLNIQKKNLYGIELDEKRAEDAAEHANVSQGSFFDTRIVPVRSFSMAWVNPPYEDEISQGDGSKALELQFIKSIHTNVELGGLIILHMPADRVDEAITRAFIGICHGAKRIILPQEMRPYRETLLVGVKRPLVETHVWNNSIEAVHDMPAFVLPDGTKPRAFNKAAPTDTELLEEIPNASFWKVFTETKVRPKLRPVLPMGAGHIGLTLASGALDGMLCPKNCESHVVRGIAFKESELAKDETTEADDGRVTNTKTYRENIKLKIRAVTRNGTIHEIK